MVDLLQLSLVPFLTSFADDSNSVEPDFLTIAIAIYNEQNQRGDILELDEAEGDGRGTRLIPVLALEGDDLSGRDILRLVEA